MRQRNDDKFDSDHQECLHSGTPGYYIEQASRSIACGRPALAFDIVNEGLEVFPGQRELRYLAALALARTGSDAEALRFLSELLQEALPPEDALQVDILSLAGSLAKDRWSRLPEGVGRALAGEQARDFYRRAYDLTGSHFPGINAASMSLLTGQVDEAQRLAREVRATCLINMAAQAGEDVWLLATLGEASLLLDENALAAHWYRKAIAVIPGCHGNMASMRRQVRLLERQLKGAGDILRLLAAPRIAVFSGYMIDAPDRGSERFPPRIEAAVGDAIAHAIRELDIGIGYCSAASGSDILFIEQMLAQGAEVNIILPFCREDFITTSVAPAGSGWVARFENALARATSVSYGIEEGYLGDDLLFAYASELIRGYALLRAEMLGTEAVMLAVAEPRGVRKTAGTAVDLQNWRALGRSATVIDINRIRLQQDEGGEAHLSEPHQAIAVNHPNPMVGQPWGHREIRTLLFADVVGFSRLRESDLPQFLAHFLAMVDNEVGACRVRPCFGNTWGDGLYLVFRHSVDAAGFALRLTDAVASCPWEEQGLPSGLSIRIGLHTGPVFRARDPIIGHHNYFGSHVTRAARIEPITAPGCVYVTEQTAASLAGSRSQEFLCHYLGILSLAKGFGKSRIFRLLRPTSHR